MDGKALLKEGCRKLGITICDPAFDRLEDYLSELIKWNRKMNLVAAAPVRELIDSHFLDCLTLLPVLESWENQRLLDVGTGAGFPGLVLKCALDPLALTLVEPREKRVTFLRHMVRKLELDQVEILDQRLDPVNEAKRTFPLITSRALSSLAAFLELITAWSPSGGLVICMKGPKADEELAQWRAQAPDSPFVVESHQTLTLPFSGATRNLLVFRRR